MPRNPHRNSRAVLKIGDIPEVTSRIGKAVAEMKNSEDKFRVMVDTIPALVWCTLPDGSNEFHNQEGAEHGWGWRVAYHPEDLEQLLAKWQAVLTSGEPGEFEARLRRFDGEYRWFLIRAVPLRDETGKIVYWYGSSTDIEDRKRAEEKLRQDERELRRITDAIAQTIVVQSPDGVPIYANQAVLDYTGLTIEDVTASDFRAQIFHPEDIERLREERQAALSRGVPFEMASIAGSSSATTRSTTNRDAWCGGMRREPTSKIANGQKIGRETRTLRCVKKSTAPRCSRKSSAPP